MTLAFTLKDARLLVDGLSEAKGLSVVVNDLPAEQKPEVMWNDGQAIVALPPRFFDGQEHTLSLINGEATHSFTHRSQYVGKITRTYDRLEGWLYDLTRPDAVISLDVVVNGSNRRAILASEASEAAPEGKACGFEDASPLGRDDLDIKMLGLRITGTDHYPLGVHLIGVKPFHLQPEFIQAEPRAEVRRTLASLAQSLALEAARGKAPAALPDTCQLYKPGPEPRSGGGVDVIIPVYKGLDETLACIRSVLSAKTAIRYNLIVIDDASPEPELSEALRNEAREKGFRLLVNDTNLGFVRTVNRGMRLSADNDVVLLNADTEVGDGWLDRLQAAAYCADDVATVTPLSNNATICSLPTMKGSEGIPYGQDLGGINALCAEVNGGQRAELPTGHGFCLYIRRQALREVGVFDHLRFGRGYGEENDFCLRATARGWRHLAALDVFVYHKGSVSFGSQTKTLIEQNLKLIAEDHPDYGHRVALFMADDPLAAARNRLQARQWRDKPVVVFLSLAIGGGVDTHIEFLAGRLTGEGYRVLIATRATDPARGFRLREWDTHNQLVYPERLGLNALLADVVALNPAFLHLHHLIDLGDGIDRFLTTARIPYYVTLHDYFYICPRVTMLDDGGAYSGLPDAKVCNICLKHAGPHPATDESLRPAATDIIGWRRKWLSLLKGARMVIAPSQAAAALYRRAMPGLAIKVLPHLGPEPPRVKFQSRKAPKEIRVALLGALGPHKGSEQLVALLRWAEKNAPDMRFVLVGHTDKHDLFNSFSNLQNLGPYTAKTRDALLDKAACQVALFLSPWPETYGYTLSEAVIHGLTPVAYNLGAMAERIRALGCGQLVTLGEGPAAVHAVIQKAAAQRVVPGSYSEGRYGPVIESYYSFKPDDVAQSATSILPGGTGLSDDRWCAPHTEFELIARHRYNQVTINLDQANGIGAQTVLVTVRAARAEGGAILVRQGFDLTKPYNQVRIALPPTRGVIGVALDFSHYAKLPDPDIRLTSAMLGGVSLDFTETPATAVSRADVPALFEESQLPVISSFDEVDGSGRLEQLYRDIVGYSLNMDPRDNRSGLGHLVSDLAWSARVARRQGPVTGLKTLRALRTLRNSSFDRAFYRQQLAGNAWARLDPVTHYVLFGAKEGFDPAPGFSTGFYTKAHEDLQAANINPFQHYLTYGRKENRRVEPSDKIGLFFRSIEGLSSGAGPNGRPGGAHSAMIQALGVASSAPAENQTVVWPKRDQGDATGPFDARPDDSVIEEAKKGAGFFKQFKLLERNPPWEKAVKALNALPRPPAPSAPHVSIIIPVYGQLAYTLNCLHSLIPHDSKYSFEILVGDDASPDQSGDWLPRVEGIRHIRHAANEGFIANCNKTAQDARGQYLVFLNNDTRVVPGWLDALIDTFAAFPKAGMAGSKLFYPDASLQEAGGIVWRDGSAWNYGRNDDPNRPQYCYARPADYISGASIAVKSEKWDALAGFDAHYSPAYYEDTDLAMRLHQQGQDVVMQPLSRVIHYEGKTSGTDTGQGVKANQTTNREKFLARWSKSLQSHRKNGEEPWLESNRRPRRVLILDATNPRPGFDAGSLATYDLFRSYQALGYHVIFAPEDNFLFEADAVPPMQAMGVECHYAPYTNSVTGLLSQIGRHLDVVHLIRPDVAGRNIDIVRRLAPQARLVYLNADLHHVRLARQAQLENSAELEAKAEAMKRKEMAISERVDVNLVHSSYEKGLIEAAAPRARVEVLPLIETLVVPQAPLAGRRDIMFLGGYNHPPNVDAAMWILNDIWPRLADALPDSRLILAGSNPPESLRARAGDRIVVTGTVPSLTPWFEHSRVFLAALRYGAGAKGKILAAMAHGVPVVATPVAAEGMPLTPGKDVFVADTAQGLADTVLKLYRAEPEVLAKHSEAAQVYVRTHHSFDRALSVLRAAVSA